MNLINWIKRQIEAHKQKKLEAWKIKQLPENCQQCELLGICRVERMIGNADVDVCYDNLRGGRFNVYSVLQRTLYSA